MPRNNISIIAVLALVIAGYGDGYAREDKRPDITGVWTNALLSPDDERWRIEDLACARSGCSLAGFKYLQALLANPENDGRSVKELFYETQDYEKQQNEDLLTPGGMKKQAEYDPAQDAALDCTSEGDSLRHQILAPVPMQIEQFDDRVIFSYEYWNAVRTVFLDGRAYPADAPHTRLGHSIGRYEGDTLIVETTHVIPNVIGVPGRGALAPDKDTRFIERYTYHAGNDRLDLELAIIDSVNFRKPYENQRSFLPAPDWELEEFVCEAITGEY